MTELLSVRELRTNLREVLNRANRGELFEVGAQRKAEAVLLSRDRYRREAVPDLVLSHLLLLCALEAAETAMTQERGAIWNPGDQFGRVLGWLWASGRRGDAALMVANTIGQARSDYAEQGRPRIAFSDLLRGIPNGLWADDVPDSEVPELLAYLRAEVPQYGPDLEDA